MKGSASVRIKISHTTSSNLQYIIYTIFEVMVKLKWVKWMPLLFLTNDLRAPRTLHKSRHRCNCFTNEPIIYSAWDNLPLKLIFRWLLIRYALSCNMLMRLLHFLISLFRKSSMHGKAKQGLKDKAWSSIHLSHVQQTEYL